MPVPNVIERSDPIRNVAEMASGKWERWPGTKTSCAIYAVCLGLTVAVWLLAVRSPLWLDETGSYWQISAGFSQIWPRQYLCLAFPAYSYILWFASILLGTSEAALRAPSILAMLGAAYLVYLSARELFGREMGALAAIIFCANPIVIFESIDARPYAFEMLATSASILILLKLRKSESMWLAGLFGLLCALIVYFHFLGAIVLPALLIGFVAVKRKTGQHFWRQLCVGLIVFVIAFLPLLPGLIHLFGTGKTHVFQTAPTLGMLFSPFESGLLPFAFGAAAIVAGLTMRSGERCNFQRWKILVCIPLAVIPVFILFGVSEWTSIHMYNSRHLSVAVPGIALIWALAMSPFRSRTVRMTFCVVLAGIVAAISFASPLSRQHGPYTWKYALTAVEKDASQDHSPVLICSDFPESDFVKMSPALVSGSVFYGPLSYYHLTVPVVPLPRALNAEAKRAGTAFLETATAGNKRFLAAAWFPSYPTLAWLKEQVAGTYSVTELGAYDGVIVLNFVPRKHQ